MAVLHCLYGLVRTRDWRFLTLIGYGFLHAALLIPVRIRALATLTDSGWGTRTGEATAAAAGTLGADATVSAGAVSA